MSVLSPGYIVLCVIDADCLCTIGELCEGRAGEVGWVAGGKAMKSLALVNKLNTINHIL